MPILHHCAQRTERWHILRRGIATSSEFSRIWTPPGKPTATGRAPKYPLGHESDQWEQYAHRLLYQRITGLEDDDPKYRSPAMDRGVEIEPDAIEWYKMIHDMDIQPIGFITTDDGKLGCSPDGLVGDDGLIEFKAPYGHTHLGYFLKEDIEPGLALRALDERYWVQLQGQLHVCWPQRKWVDVVSHHPVLVPRNELRVCIRVYPDEEYIGAMASGLRAFNHYLDGVSERLCPDWMERKQAALDALPKPAQPVSTSAALRARLEIIP